MKMSSNEEYGLRFLVQLARHEERETGEPLGIPGIAASEGLGQAHVAKIMRLLRQGGLVDAFRGARGGYRLARPASGITLYEALAALDGAPFGRWPCDSGPGQTCVHDPACSLRVLWRRLGQVMRGVLEGLTVADLLSGHESMAQLLDQRVDTGSFSSAELQELRS